VGVSLSTQNGVVDLTLSGCVMMTKEWLLKIAQAIEDWPAMLMDDVAVAMSVSTPADAVKYIVNKHVPIEERTRVSAGLPLLTTDDFAAAAQQIREAAEALD
jgi:hypothetical protein